jgi:hypothetical protein
MVHGGLGIEAWPEEELIITTVAQSSLWLYQNEEDVSVVLTKVFDD